MTQLTTQCVTVLPLILFDKKVLNINTACNIQHLPFQRSYLHKRENFVPDG